MGKGYKHTEEWKKKASKRMKGVNNPFYGRKHTPETLEKLRITSTGRKSSPEKIEKIKEWCRKNPDKLSYWKGKKQSEEMVEKRILKGEEHYEWIPDRTKLSRINKQGERRTSAYFFWRKSVWVRDNWKCRIADVNCDGRLEAHHILGWKDHPELRYEINNGITLCHFHHPRKREEEKRLSPYFMELVSVSKE